MDKKLVKIKALEIVMDSMTFVIKFDYKSKFGRGYEISPWGIVDPMLVYSTSKRSKACL